MTAPSPEPLPGRLPLHVPAGRLRLYGAAWLVLAAVLLVLFARHIAGWAGGRPADTDFASFYAAAALAWQGQAAAAWDRAAHTAMQVAVLGGPGRSYAFFYPPHYLLACLPLPLLPVAAALGAWVVATGAVLALALRAMGLGWFAVALLLASPAGLLNAMSGQNAFLTAGLFAWVGLAMTRRPGLAGVCLGLLTMKPQLGLLVVPGLVAGGRWRVAGWAVAATAGLVALSAAVFGVEAWGAFLGVGGAARDGMEGRLELEKMQSVFALARQMGAAPPIAYAAQAVVAGVALAVAWPLLRTRVPGPETAAVMATGGLLMTPFLQFYDLVLLLAPMAMIAQGPLRAWDRVGLVVLFVGPGLSFFSGVWWGVPLGPFVVGLALVMLRRRVLAMRLTGC